MYSRPCARSKKPYNYVSRSTSAVLLATGFIASSACFSSRKYELVQLLRRYGVLSQDAGSGSTRVGGVGGCIDGGSNQPKLLVCGRRSSRCYAGVK